MTRRRADLLLLLATAMWGTSFVAVKSALAYATPFAFLTVRFGLAAALLAPGTRFRPLPRGRELWGGLLLGALVAGGFVSVTLGLLITTPSRAAFIVSISSVLAPVIAFVALRRRPGWLAISALAIAGLGVYFLTAPDSGGLNRGDLVTLICAVCFAGQIVAITELAPYSEPRRLVWIQIAATALLSGVAALLLERPRITWTAEFAAALAWTVVFASTVSFVLQAYAQRHMSSARAALIFCFEPLFAAAASWVVLGERLSLLQWGGGALILVGMVLAELPVRSSVIRCRSSVGSERITDHGSRIADNG
ncbi:MAG TPA: DMT family transporter [Gemmatimonadales bacterium]|nr:DMT family transporter [Gemmatimonadales bacterium]